MKKICQLTIPTHQFWRLVQFCDCRRPVRVFVCSSSEVLILTTATHRFIKNYVACSAFYYYNQARDNTSKEPLYKLRKYTSDSTHRYVLPYSYTSWCYTQWEINSPFAKQKHPWLYFCYVLQSSPRSLFLRGAANKLISSRSRFWFLVRAHQWLPSLSNLYSQTKLLARPAVRHGRRARAKKISGPKWPSSSLGKNLLLLWILFLHFWNLAL